MLVKLNIPKPSAFWIYLIITAIESLALSLAYTVNIVYQVTQVGLDPLQLVLVGTALEGTIFLFEIPTGVIADVYSRRLSVLLGFTLLGIGIIVEGTFPLFEAIIIAEIIAGIGYTFLSGATTAWIVDEIGQEESANAFMRSSQVGQVIWLVGPFVSVAIASINLQLAIVTGGLILIGLVFFLALVMPEEGFQRVPQEERESWSDLFSTFREGATLVRGRRILMAILLITIIYGAFTEGYDRLWTAHLLTNFTLPQLGGFNEIVWFAIISAVFKPVTLIATEIVRRKVDFKSSQAIGNALSIVYVGLMLSVLVFAQANVFWLVLLGLWMAGLFRTVSYPLMDAWINQHTESKVRATVLSIKGQADAFGQIGGGPIVGAIGALTSVRMAITLSALMLSPLVAVFKRTLKQES